MPTNPPPDSPTFDRVTVDWADLLNHPTAFTWRPDDNGGITLVTGQTDVTQSHDDAESDDLIECVSCGIESDDLTDLNGDTHCPDCTTWCDRCHTTYPTSDTVTVGPWSRTLCTDCAATCDHCGQWWIADDLNYLNGDSLCGDCVHYCDECDNYYAADESCHCPERVSGLEPYGHTSPSMWLGGPLPRNGANRPDGFYIGFEHEVSADGGDTYGLARWAEANLGKPGSMSFKEDSSVEGFEIVSQPMTPEFFESINWDAYFRTLNSDFPLYGDEPDHHGIHVHIGRVAFEDATGKEDGVALAMFTYLLGTGPDLERIARREPTGYCEKVHKPVSAAIVSHHNQTGTVGARSQYNRAHRNAGYLGRNAINLLNSSTVEIRAFRSTREAEDLKAAVRVVYLAARYVRHLRATKQPSSSALTWPAFTKWVLKTHPHTYKSVARPRGK